MTRRLHRLDDEQFLICLDVLLAATWADAEFASAESETIQRVVIQMTGADAVTPEMQRYIESFDPDKFSLEAACHRLGFTSDAFGDAEMVEKRRAFLTVVGMTVEADGILEEEEEKFIGALSSHLGVEMEDFSHLEGDVSRLVPVLAAPPPPTLHAGDCLSDRFEILRSLREVPFGRVYSARDRFIGNRLVEARLVTSIVAKGDVHRFMHDAFRVGTTGSPFLATALGAGGMDEGTPYLVSEPSPGVTLRTYLDAEGIISPEKALCIADGILGALEAAHARGVYHRQLTPAEVVLLDVPGAEGNVKLTDFGACRLFDCGEAASSASASLRVAGDSHLSPERLHSAATDGRADIYGVASILFEALTGQLAYMPVSEDSTGIRSRLALRWARPSPQSLLEANPELEGATALDALLKQALSADPADRPDSASAFRAALRAAR